MTAICGHAYLSRKLQRITSLLTALLTLRIPAGAFSCARQWKASYSQNPSERKLCCGTNLHMQVSNFLFESLLRKFRDCQGPVQNACRETSSKCHCAGLKASPMREAPQTHSRTAEMRSKPTLMSLDSLRLESLKWAVGPPGRWMSSSPLTCFLFSLNTITSVKPRALAYFTIFLMGVPCTSRQGQSLKVQG